MANALNREPGELLFLDDNAENVERAASLGMHAMVVADTEQTVDELRALPALPGSAFWSATRNRSRDTTEDS